MRWLSRRRRQPAARALPGWPAGAAQPDSLRDDLVRHLYASLVAVSSRDRPRARWVMTADWLNECRKCDQSSPFARMPTGAPETLLGLPIEVREGSGPPHLELTQEPKP